MSIIFLNISQVGLLQAPFNSHLHWSYFMNWFRGPTLKCLKRLHINSPLNLCPLPICISYYNINILKSETAIHSLSPLCILAKSKPIANHCELNTQMNRKIFSHPLYRNYLKYFYEQRLFLPMISLPSSQVCLFFLMDYI